MQKTHVNERVLDVSRPPPETGGTFRFVYALYQILLHFILPVFLLVLLNRSRREPAYRHHLRERFGRIMPKTRGRVLVYATSLGETRAASPVISQLLARGETILLTHSSPAGRAEGRRLFAAEIDAGHIVQAYMPVDLFWALRRFLTQHKPRLTLVVEAELWPGLMIESRRAGIPVVQINGNYTKETLLRDQRRLRWLRKQCWRLFSLVLTKSEERAACYRDIGISADRVMNVGELKFDLPVNHAQTRAATRCRPALCERAVLTIASSIEAEEPILFSMVEQLCSALPRPPLILWVPRSPQRFDAVAEAAKTRGYSVAKRSTVLGPDFSPKAALDMEILVGDTLGEMDFYYALSDVVFVGATLVDMGGHNIIEPLALERPVVTGPSLFGIAYPAYEAIDAGALRAANGGEELSRLLIELFENPPKLSDFTDKTRGFNALHKGASLRTVEALSPFLGGEA